MADVAGQQVAGKKALAVVEQVRTKFVALPARRRNSLLGAALGLLAIVALGSWYMGRPDWKVLFSGLEAKDVMQVSQELGAAGIPFQTTTDGGGVEVPSELVDKARMEVAAKGMPASGRLGFELFDKPNWVGSEYDERVNYQRAMEGELEHTIATLGVVRSARVHLVLPKESLFAAEKQPAKASVVLKLKKSNLGAEQVDSIRNFVAGAVEGLTPDQVTLVDADGRVNLAAHGGSGASEGDAEQAMEAKLVAMLEPLAGAGNVRATVNVAYDEGREERTDEVYDPAGSVALSVDKKEQNGGGRMLASGVPGTASNAPAAAVKGAVAGSAAAASEGTPPLLKKDSLPVYPGGPMGGATTKEESGTYAVTKHFVHTEQGPGRVKRVTAAVVVNDREVSEAGKPMAWRPRTQEEMHRLEMLAQGAVGFDEKRGDVVTMENVGFSSNVPEVRAAGVGRVLEEAGSWVRSQPGLMKTGVLGVLGLMVVLLVLKPVAGQVVATLKEPLVLRSEVTETKLIAAEAAASATSGTPETPVAVGEKRFTALTGESVFEQVSQHVRREPAQSTRLLQAWIGGVEEG